MHQDLITYKCSKCGHKTVVARDRIGFGAGKDALDGSQILDNIKKGQCPKCKTQMTAIKKAPNSFFESVLSFIKPKT